MLVQPQCFTWPCDPIELGSITPSGGGNTGIAGGLIVPGAVNGSYPVPPIIARDPYAQNGTASPTNGTPIFRATTSELDKYRLLFLIIGVAIGYYLLKR